LIIKLSRIFFGGYIANKEAMGAKKYISFPLRSLILPIPVSANHGFGEIKGVTKKMGVNYSPVSVCVFRRDNRQLIWETKSRVNGSYVLLNIAKGLECFVVAFDPNEEYNAVISDKVVAK